MSEEVEATRRETAPVVVTEEPAVAKVEDLVNAPMAPKINGRGVLYMDRAELLAPRGKGEQGNGMSPDCKGSGKYAKLLTPEQVMYLKANRKWPYCNPHGRFKKGEGGPPRKKGNYYLSDVVKMMLGWPEEMVVDVLKNDQQPTGARLAAAQVLLAMRGEDTSVDRVWDRTEGKVAADININTPDGREIGGDAKKAIESDVMKEAFKQASQDIMPHGTPTGDTDLGKKMRDATRG